MKLPVKDENGNNICEVEFSIAVGSLPEEINDYLHLMPLPTKDHERRIKKVHFDISGVPEYIEVYNLKE